MSTLEALILGIIQGLTEFLPISSSGHLELGKAILGTSTGKDITFTIVVHGATVLSTIVVFRKDIIDIFRGLIDFKWNDSVKYSLKMAASMIPIGIVGLFFKDEVESLFNDNVMFVGLMLLITGSLLTFTYYARKNDSEVTYLSAIIIGIAQAAAVLPGISRSGATIATGLLLGVRREVITRFSFLMVLVPIIGANIKDLSENEFANSSVEITPLLIGFVAAFIAGLAACKWMIKIVNKGKLIWFAAYCFVAGSIAIIVELL